MADSVADGHGGNFNKMTTRKYILGAIFANRCTLDFTDIKNKH